MTEERPRPQYGEYATPQDQARAIAGSQPPISAHLVPHVPAKGAPDKDGAGKDGAGKGAAARLFAPRPRPGASDTRATPRRWDLILTTALLAYGAINVVSQLSRSTNLSAVIAQFYAMQGIGTYQPTQLATTLGIVLTIVTVVLFVVTAYVAVRQLRRGRLAFYIPLIGGAIATVITVSFVIVLLTNDPTFIAYMNGLRPGG